MTKIVVPEGMIEAAAKAIDKARLHPDFHVRETRDITLEAALLWLTNNPRPMDISLAREFDEKYPPNYNRQVLIAHAAEEWQRQMFLSTEPEIPEEIKDLLLDENPPPFLSTVPQTMQSFVYTIGEFEKKQNAKIIEAYHRGQQSKDRS